MFPIAVTHLVPPTAIVQKLEKAAPAPKGSAWIVPGAVWTDDRGEQIQAHGGGILHEGNTFYWFGEDRSRDNRPGTRCVACYSSTDLVHWTFRNKVVKLTDPASLGKGWVLERPKVFHNKKTGKYVMYAHLDDGRYKLAAVAVFVSDTVDGDYRYVHEFRPLNLESRDIGQFVDDDGTPYLIFESRPSKGFYIAALSDDYLKVTKQVAFLKAPLEGGAVVHYEGLYYALGSALTGWSPNPNKFATARRLEGPWSEFSYIAPREKRTYGSQSTLLLKIVGSEKTTVIFMGDEWRPKNLWDSRYLWMPVEINRGKLTLPEPRPWTIDVATGVVRFK
ncbi:MAG: family 43 glycosylhydrolase [Tepidisphaeraceae bacterium]